MITIREPYQTDANAITKMIHSLAEFENMSDSCTITEDKIQTLFFEEKVIRGILAFEDNTLVGIATYYFTISTFKGSKTLYLEDLFINEEYRSKGIGLLLMNQTEQIAKQKGCSQMEWKCLNWNGVAQDFYLKFGGYKNPDWESFYKTLSV